MENTGNKAGIYDLKDLIGTEKFLTQDAQRKAYEASPEGIAHAQHIEKQRQENLQKRKTEERKHDLQIEQDRLQKERARARGENVNDTELIDLAEINAQIQNAETATQKNKKPWYKRIFGK